MNFKLENFRPLFGVALFCLITYSFHFLWWWAAPYFKATGAYQATGEFMTNQVYVSAAWVMKNMLGMDFTMTVPRTFHFVTGPAVSPAGALPVQPALMVNDSCSGLKQFFQIAVVFLLFPGPWKHKAWFIPAAILVMHAVNIFRIIILSIILINWPGYWQFSHDWILRPFFYVVIFAEWLIWEIYFQNKQLKRNRKQPTAYK